MASGSASDDTVLDPSIQEGKTCGQCRSGSSSNSSGRPTKRTNSSQESSCSLRFIQSGISPFHYSSDFEDNTSRSAVNGTKDNIVSEEKNCGTSQKSRDKDSSEIPISEGSGSYIIPLPQKPKTKEQILPDKQKRNEVHPKGGKALPKNKLPKKNTFITVHTINAQRKNKMACRLLSARDQRIKQLKNEAAVLRKKLQVFSTENKTLKQLQCRHEKAIRKYEHAEINLPDLLASQANEVRALRAYIRISQEEERKASMKLRDVQAQLLKTTDALRALQKLCEDKKIEEREELQQKLTSFLQKLEASEKKTQELEKELNINTASFRHQLAVEQKKIIEAQSNSRNLQQEVESLKQKLQERDRELGIINIYANRMHKGQRERAETSSSPKVVEVNKGIQVSISRKAKTLQKPEPDVSPMTFHKEMKANMEVEEIFNVAKTLDPETGVPLPGKSPVENISIRTFMGSQSEDICPRVEENIQNENGERSKDRRERPGSDLLEAESKEFKTEPVEKEEVKAEKEAKEALSDMLTPVIERHRTTSTSQKQYVFSEAIQNLHQGFPSTGPKVPCSGRRRNRQEGRRADFMGDSVNNYEPSFAKFPQEKQKDTPSTPTEETSPKISPEKKRLVLERLFGPNRVFSSTDPNSHLSTEGHGEKPLPREKNRFDEV